MLKAAYRNELEKLLCRKKYLVFLIFDLIAVVGWTLLQTLASIFAQKALDVPVAFEALHSLGYTPYMMIFIPFIALLACADLFSGEYHDLSIRMVLQRPVERYQIYIAKVAAVFTVCVGFILAHYVFLLVIKLLFGKTAAGAGLSLLMYLCDCIPVLVVVLFFAFLHQLIKSPASAVALSVMAFGALLLIGKYVTVAGGMVFTEYLTWHSLWIGKHIPFLVMLPKIGILGSTGVIFYCVGYELFRRKGI